MKFHVYSPNSNAWIDTKAKCVKLFLGDHSFLLSQDMLYTSLERISSYKKSNNKQLMILTIGSVRIELENIDEDLTFVETELKKYLV